MPLCCVTTFLLANMFVSSGSFCFSSTTVSFSSSLLFVCLAYFSLWAALFCVVELGLGPLSDNPANLPNIYYLVNYYPINNYLVWIRLLREQAPQQKDLQLCSYCNNKLALNNLYHIFHYSFIAYIITYWKT